MARSHSSFNFKAHAKKNVEREKKIAEICTQLKKLWGNCSHQYPPCMTLLADPQVEGGGVGHFGQSAKNGSNGFWPKKISAPGGPLLVTCGHPGGAQSLTPKNVTKVRTLFKQNDPKITLLFNVKTETLF